MKILLAGRFGAVLAAAGVLGLAGCGSDALPTAADAPGLPLFAVGDVTSATPEYGMVKLCKAGDVSGTFTVTRVAEGASTGTVEANPTIAAGSCIVVAEDVGGNGVGSHVTFTESPATYLTGVTGQRIDKVSGSDVISTACVGTPDPCANPGTVFVNSFHGYTFTFTNILPPPAGQGCSPGYWKNHTEAGDWPAPYTPDMLFSAVFEDAFGSQTLLEVLNNGGGGLNALGRQTVSALLNAAALPGVFEMTPTEVIDAFNDVYPGTKAEYNELKAIFEALIDVDDRICPFN